MISRLKFQPHRSLKGSKGSFQLNWMKDCRHDVADFSRPTGKNLSTRSTLTKTPAYCNASDVI